MADLGTLRGRKSPAQTERTEANPASSALALSTPTAYHLAWSAPQRTGTIPRCWHQHWTYSRTWAHPETTRVHLDAGYDPGVTRTLLAEWGLQRALAHKGLPAPIQATKRWPVERTHSWHNNFYKLARCAERRKDRR
jgi:hypothetical protein